MMLRTEEIPKPDADLKIVTPFWDVLTRYLTGVIMIIALATAALQAAKDNMICMPAVNCTGVGRITTQNASKIHIDVCYKAEKELSNDSTSVVITTMADFRQYAYVESACFQKILQWYLEYFPFILFTEAVIFIMIDNFWIMYPKTSTALNHFVMLVMECYRSVGTFSDILQVLRKPKTSDSNSDDTENKCNDKDDEEEWECYEEFGSFTASELPRQGRTSTEEVSETNPTTFDMKAAIEVKTLYEKMKNFRKKYNNSTHGLLRLYKCRILIQMFFSVLILVDNYYYLYMKFTNSVNCHLDEIFLTKYEFFMCSRVITPYYRAMFLVFHVPVLIYLLMSCCSLFWTLDVGFKHSNLDKKYTSDNFKIKGDLAFFISLLEQCNKLYSNRLLLFLSKKHTKKLESTIEKAYSEGF